MKLHLTATSERGKPVSKSGNDFVEVSIMDENRQKIVKLLVAIDEDIIRCCIKTGENVWLDNPAELKTIGN